MVINMDGGILTFSVDDDGTIMYFCYGCNFRSVNAEDVVAHSISCHEGYEIPDIKIMNSNCPECGSPLPPGRCPICRTCGWGECLL